MSVDQGAGPTAPPTALHGGHPPTTIRALPRARVRLGRRSLTVRLLMGVVALVVLLLGAISASTYYALRSFLYDRLDQQVQAISSGAEHVISHCLSNGISQCAFDGPGDYRAPQAEWVAVLDNSGTSVVDVTPSEALRPMMLNSALRHHLAAHPPDAQTVTTTDNVSLRISAQRIGTNSNGFLVLSGLPTDEVSRTLSRLVKVELIIGLGAVAIALAATAWGVRRSLRNLYGVTGTAREVAAELSPTGAGLERRVPVTEEGTEVAELATSFNTMLAAVEAQFAARVASEQRMRQFLADASHELRTPLTSIRGFAELARMQRAAGGETGADDDNLDRIESEGTRMSRLVDDLLILARGEDTGAHPPERDPVEIVSLLDDVVSSSRAAFPDRPIEMSVDTPPLVLGDRDQLLRVVRNLVTNAAVHTEAGRPIHVRGFGEPGAAVITVTDGGPGLAPEDAAQVFDRFWRADKARSRARGGSGLGMSIVAAIVRAHGGSVRFDSDVESGSVVTVRLPAAPTM